MKISRERAATITRTRPFRIVATGEPVQARESWNPQPVRAGVIACRFMVHYRGRWRRLFSNLRARSDYPHFINVDGNRVAVRDVAP